MTVYNTLSTSDTKRAPICLSVNEGWVEEWIDGIENRWRKKANCAEVTFCGEGRETEEKGSSRGQLINWAFIYHNSGNGRRRLTPEEKKIDYHHQIMQYLNWPTATPPQKRSSNFTLRIGRTKMQWVTHKNPFFFLLNTHVTLGHTIEVIAASSYLVMVLGMVFDRGEIRAPQTSIGFVTVKYERSCTDQYLLLPGRAECS